MARRTYIAHIEIGEEDENDLIARYDHLKIDETRRDDFACLTWINCALTFGLVQLLGSDNVDSGTVVVTSLTRKEE